MRAPQNNRKWPGPLESLGTVATAPGRLQGQTPDTGQVTGDRAGSLEVWQAQSIASVTPWGVGRGVWECDFLLGSGRQSDMAGGTLAGIPSGPELGPPGSIRGPQGLDTYLRSLQSLRRKRSSQKLPFRLGGGRADTCLGEHSQSKCSVPLVRGWGDW